MSSKVDISRIARRYALAGFSWAEESKKLKELEKDLSTLEAIVNDVPELKAILETPLISRSEHGKSIEALCKKAKISDVMKRVMGVAAENRRLNCVPAIITELKGLLAEHNGVVTVDVLSASDLSSAQIKKITDVLKKSLGRSIEIKQIKDDSLIGGVVIKAGSLMIDNSIKTQLKKMSRVLKNSEIVIEKETMKEVA